MHRPQDNLSIERFRLCGSGGVLLCCSRAYPRVDHCLRCCNLIGPSYLSVTLLFHIALSTRCVERASPAGPAWTLFHLSSSEPLQLKTSLKPQNIPTAIPTRKFKPTNNGCKIQIPVHLILPKPRGNMRYNSNSPTMGYVSNVSSPLNCSGGIHQLGITHPCLGTHILQIWTSGPLR